MMSTDIAVSKRRGGRTWKLRASALKAPQKVARRMRMGTFSVQLSLISQGSTSPSYNCTDTDVKDHIIMIHQYNISMPFSVHFSRISQGSTSPSYNCTDTDVIYDVMM